MVTLKAIAEAVNLDVSVVSRALNPSPDRHAVIRPETRRRIVEAAARMKYRPNRQASFLKKGRVPTILCFLPDSAYDLIADLMIGISEAACHEDFPVSFLFGSRSDDYQRFLRAAEESSNSGILSYPPQKFSQEIQRSMESYLAKGGRMLLLNVLSNTPRPGAGSPVFRAIPQLNIDDHHGGRLVAEHFLARGCEEFHLCCDPSQEVVYGRRLAGYADTLAARGIPVRRCRYPFPVEDLGRSGRRAGLFAVNDALALNIEMAMARKGIVPGREVLLAGFNDLHYCSRVEPSLTSVHQPMRETGSRAVRKLIRMIFNQEEETETILPTLVVRESSDPQAPGEEEGS